MKQVKQGSVDIKRYQIGYDKKGRVILNQISTAGKVAFRFIWSHDEAIKVGEKLLAGELIIPVPATEATKLGKQIIEVAQKAAPAIK